MNVALAVLAVLSLSVRANAQSGTVGAGTPTNLDAIFLRDGQRRAGRVTKLDAESFTFDVPLVPGQPAAIVRIPRSSVSQIEFAPNEAREQYLRKSTPAQISEIDRWYRQQKDFLTIPRSPIGRVGIRLGELRLAKGEAESALAIFQEIESASWSEGDRFKAKQGRLRAMIAVGRAAEAIDEARELAKSAEAPEILIEANFILAQAADQELRKLIEENPRWREDDRIRPKRDRLYHQAADFYLHPYLFFGSRAETSARSLWKLVQLYEFTADQEIALETARDLIALYPETEQAVEAERWVSGLASKPAAIDYEHETATNSPRSPRVKP
ncbi:MAG: hypothetical protein ABI680_00380 [Chthoniobacteraceae bacterium]